MIKRLINKIFRQKKNGEDRFYTEMFVENSSWNTAEPNEEEELRLEIINDFMSFIKERIKAIEILDVGSGRGWLTYQLNSFGVAKGIEPVGDVVNYARKLFPNIDFFVGSSNDLTKVFGSKKFDVIVCSEVIEHIADDEKSKFVDNLKSFLNTNGYLILTTPRREEQSNWMKLTNPNQPIEDWMTEQEVEDIFHRNKFNTINRKRFSISPNNSKILIEIYQLWLFQKN